MKRTYLLLMFCFSGLTCLAQPIWKAATAPVTDAERIKLSTRFSEFQVISIPFQSMNEQLKASPRAAVLFSFFKQFGWELTLTENEIRSAAYHSIRSDGRGERIEPAEKCNTYGGYLNGDPAQWVRFYVSDKMLKGIILDKNRGYFSIESLSSFTGPSTSTFLDNRFVLYNLSAVKDSGKGCELLQAGQPFPKPKPGIISGARRSSNTPRILELATDADFEWFQARGSNSNADILAILNNVDGL